MAHRGCRNMVAPRLREGRCSTLEARSSTPLLPVTPATNRKSHSAGPTYSGVLHPDYSWLHPLSPKPGHMSLINRHAIEASGPVGQFLEKWTRPHTCPDTSSCQSNRKRRCKRSGTHLHRDYGTRRSRMFNGDILRGIRSRVCPGRVERR